MASDLEDNESRCVTLESISSSDSGSDDTDLEDLSYLRKMCVGFVAKLKEDKRRIKVYENGLINSQLNLVKREAAHLREMRKILVGNKIRREVVLTEGNGKDPFAVFPEEIWIMIFDGIDDSNDLKNCAKVCSSFENILQLSKPQWLFEKVFPFLFNKLSRKDILTCRGVCSKWCTAVDTFLENYYSIILPDLTLQNVTDVDTLEERLNVPCVEFKGFHFEYTFNIPPPPADELDDGSDDESVPSSSDLNRCHDKYLAIMKAHPRNPFIGRSVTIEEDSADFDLGNLDQNVPSFAPAAKEFLQHFGVHIYHLSISCNMEIQTPYTFYSTLLSSLTFCPSMKSLCLTADLNWRRARGVSSSILETQPPPHSSLESLSCDTNHPKISKLLDKLIAKYSNQLKRVDVRFWNSDYSRHSWTVLRQLEIEGGNTSEILDSLLKITAPNLRVLKISLEGKGPYLESILRVCNRFSKICQLYVNFESRFGAVSDSEIIRIQPGLTAPPALTYLHLTSTVTEVKDYSFLMYFPFVEYLVIRHGYWTEAMVGGMEYDHTLGNHEEDTSCREIVKIYKYLKPCSKKGNRQSMYKSNVWDILSFLYKLLVENARVIPVKKKLYTRQGLEHFRAKHKADSKAI